MLFLFPKPTAAEPTGHATFYFILVTVELLKTSGAPQFFSWLTLTIFTVLLILLAVAIIATVTLVCYYRRRMNAIKGRPYDMGLYEGLSSMQFPRPEMLKK